MIRVVFLSLLICFCANMFGQSSELGLKLLSNLIYSNQQFETESSPFSLNGGALLFNYKKPYKETKYNYNLGIEFSFTDWGTQILSRVGANTPINDVLGVEVILLNGLALYIDNSAYVFGAEANVFYLISIKNKKRIKLNTGLRFSQNSKYKTVGNFRFIDLPIGVSWLFGNS